MMRRGRPFESPRGLSANPVAGTFGLWRAGNGTAGFDVLCVTDHVLRGDDPWPLRHGRPCVDAINVDAYLAAIERERERAVSTYGLLLVPGLELTYNDPNPDRACRAVAVGLHGLVAMEDGP
jgi:hypothetical protein